VTFNPVRLLVGPLMRRSQVCVIPNRRPPSGSTLLTPATWKPWARRLPVTFASSEAAALVVVGLVRS
jgi:hypothetical protein